MGVLVALGQRYHVVGVHRCLDLDDGARGFARRGRNVEGQGWLIVLRDPAEGEVVQGKGPHAPISPTIVWLHTFSHHMDWISRRS